VIAADFEVTYRDGTVDKVRVTQYGFAVWERWKARKGLPGDDLASTMARVLAWSELQRDTTTKVDFDKWDPTVDLVRPLGDMDAVDPTQPATSAG